MRPRPPARSTRWICRPARPSGNTTPSRRASSSCRRSEDQPKSQVESESGKNLSKDERAAYKQRLRNEKQQAKERKRLEKKRPLPRFAGGPGVGDGLVVVGALDGEVIALDAANGTEKWRAKVPNEVIAAPVIAQNMVFVRSNDGRTTAFDAATGQQRWFNAQELPSLTVRGNAPVVAGPGVLFIGNDDGTLAALAMQDGRVLWEQTIGVPEGRTELERMSDVDGAPVLDGTTLYATSFKNETVALEGPSGRPLWNRDHGGAGGVGVSSGKRGGGRQRRHRVGAGQGLRIGDVVAAGAWRVAR